MKKVVNIDTEDKYRFIDFSDSSFRIYKWFGIQRSICGCTSCEPSTFNKACGSCSCSIYWQRCCWRFSSISETSWSNSNFGEERNRQLHLKQITRCIVEWSFQIGWRRCNFSTRFGQNIERCTCIKMGFHGVSWNYLLLYLLFYFL